MEVMSIIILLMDVSSINVSSYPPTKGLERMLTLPTTTYIAIGDFGPNIGQGYIGEDFTSFDDAWSAVSDWLDDSHTAFRVIRMDLCPDTNLPEHTTDVTQEVAAKITAICEERHLDVPEMIAA